ncbi:GNAT family N-acetyltransferase [Phytomonospora endophytica]|uniref:GNAT superfamily N-acetyltransferase n=1 Tax=Phytomonospora endophytica TaxID=714109 RepID=A0A841FL54_9ACTN|nr:GNAT family N-acetyltransferase [Phytomonospora endophytica]MBB6034528.1 GNAT superfamily N-acetyltransferase [Phytomonospora endophytica]GIG70436.1 acetyltransferase [Phytomonospora endophytica]
MERDPLRTLWTDPATVPVRRLTGEDDREACMDLAADREWGREEPKWHLLFDACEVYGVDAPDGGLAGCYTLTRYGAEASAIGMVLVASRFEGRGLGRRMMTHALSVADGVVSLHATEMGRPLYEKLGFQAIDVNSSHYGHFTGPRPDGPATRPVRDVAEILAYDRDAHGLDRTALLTALHRRSEAFRVVEEDGRVRGYAAAWRNTHQLVIGPVVADDLATATVLIADIALAADAELRVDVLHSRSGLRRWTASHGIAPRFDGTYMSLDGVDVPGDARVWAPVTQAV